METQHRYQDALEQMKELFCEEAASLLTEEQIDQTLQSEKAALQFAEQHQIPLHSWMGNNIRRYCKDLLRRQQPLFALYYLLGICTEASIVLFLCFGIYTLIQSGLSRLSFSGIPGLLLIWFCSHAWNHSYVRHCVLRQCVPKNVHKFLHIVIPTLLVSLGSILCWSRLQTIYRTLNVQNTFLLCAVFLFLSGIHNVLYSSHLITFVTIGILRCGRHPEPAIRKSVTQYLDSRSIAILAEHQKTMQQMQSDPKLYADVFMNIRSHLITYRIYLLFAVLILAVFDILCIYQCLHTHDIPMLILGSITVLMISLLVVCIISCNEIIRHIAKQ